MLRETNLLLVLSLLAGPTFGQAGTCGMKCGQERWAIKTLTDNNAETVGNAASQDTTVTELIGETAPTKLTESRAPLENEAISPDSLNHRVEDRGSDECRELWQEGKRVDFLSGSRFPYSHSRSEHYEQSDDH